MTRIAAGLIERDDYRKRIEARAAELGTDGCTAVKDWNRVCCWHHDIMCRTGQDIDGNTVTREEADYLFWECNRLRSPFSLLSPRSWMRWAGVRIGALLLSMRHE